MYILKFVHLLRNFRAFGQSGTIYLEPLQDHVEEPWKAYLQLHQGEVTSCFVQRKSDKQLLWKDTEAIQWLETKEGLSWSLEESSDAVPLFFASPVLSPDHPNRPDREAKISQVVHQIKLNKQEEAGEQFSHDDQQEGSLVLVPQRIYVQVESSVELPREYKRIFALVDGHRTIVQIAQLLHYPSQRVVHILHKLQTRKLVEL